MGVGSRLMPRPSNSIRALVFFVFGEVTPSWSSFTRGSADRDFRLTDEPPSLWPGLGLGLQPELSWSDGILSCGLGPDDEGDGRGPKEELDLLVKGREMGLGKSPEPRLGLELL